MVCSLFSEKACGVLINTVESVPLPTIMFAWFYFIIISCMQFALLVHLDTLPYLSYPMKIHLLQTGVTLYSCTKTNVRNRNMSRFCFWGRFCNEKETWFHIYPYNLVLDQREWWLQQKYFHVESPVAQWYDRRYRQTAWCTVTVYNEQTNNWQKNQRTISASSFYEKSIFWTNKWRITRDKDRELYVYTHEFCVDRV